MFGAVVLAITLGIVMLDAQGSQRPRAGFRALTGPAAAAFAVPGDMRLVARESTRGNGLGVAERYRQFVGNAEVLGGQITVYSDGAGQRSAVIGAHYPGLRPLASVRVAPASAQAIAAARRPDLAGDWSANLMIRPDTARYFYRVELRGFDVRWFFWIDAETGAVMNEYDGLTTGSGTGVDGESKDLTGLTTSSSGSYRMQTGRLSTYDALNRKTLPGILATDAVALLIWLAIARGRRRRSLPH